ncbi:MAG: hypothetical protein IJY28_08240 [Clostridia bacterium]|nr:hypothetical protein [Clostridia bacterium]
MKKRTYCRRTTAWLMDDDILLKGTVLRNKFYPQTKRCGFSVQLFDRTDIGRTVFFDLQGVKAVCGDEIRVME